MSNTAMNPLQPLSRDKEGLIRFKQNKIVSFLLESGPYDLNQLACMDFTDDDRAQFAQLIGYSLRGFGELSYVNGNMWDRATSKKVSA